MFKRFAKTLLRAAVKLLYRIRLSGELSGLRDLPRLLVISNHESYADSLLLTLFLPLDPIFVLNRNETVHWVVRLTLRLVDHLLIDPTCPMAMKSVIRLIESGRPVVIFPEGRPTITGGLMKTYEGPGFVAARTGAEILPLRIDGMARSPFSRLSPERFPRQWFPRVRLCVLPLTQVHKPSAGHIEQHHEEGLAMRHHMEATILASRPEHTLFEALQDACARHGRRWHAIEDAERRYSIGEVLSIARRLGLAVSKYSSPGERIGVLLPNSVSLLGLVFGLPAFGRVAALLNPNAGSDNLQAACTAATLKLIVSSRTFVEQSKLESKLTALNGIRLIYLEDLEAASPFASLFSVFGDRISTSVDDPAVVLFTSGSEDKPKGVVLSHRALLANMTQMRAVIDFSAEDRFLVVLPLYHCFGLTCGALLPLLAGANLVLHTSPLHYRIIPELSYERSCTVLLGTNTFLANYARHANAFDFHRLRYVIAGAEKITESVRQTWFERFGVRLYEGYGTTETAPVLAVNTPMAYCSGSVGQILPGISTRLVPVPGLDTNAGRRGVLHVSGPNLMSGYLRHDQPGVLLPPSSEIGPGWHDTGDVVEIDDEGFLRIVGRVKRFAKLGGEMVPLESSEILAHHASPFAAHAAAVLSDTDHGEAIVLFTTDRTLTRDHLLAACKRLGASAIAVPQRIVVVDSLPLLASGKVDHLGLRQWAEAA